jgi:signal transduction histidine kinase
MSRPTAGERFTKRQHRGMYLAGFLFLFGVAQRRLALLDDPFSLRLAFGLIALFAILYAIQPWLFHLSQRRLPFIPTLYFAAQMFLAQAVGLLQEYLDTWLVLYILLGLQVTSSCTRKAALAWGGLFVASGFLILTYEFGLLSGVGRGMAYLILGLFLVSLDIQYANSEEAQAESRILLEELQVAHQKLQEQAAQAELLAAAQERERIAQEVHDSVGQKIFAIQLLAGTSCVLLETDPQAAGPQLAALQEQTQAALGQMRELIYRWRIPSIEGEIETNLPLPVEP